MGTIVSSALRAWILRGRTQPKPPTTPTPARSAITLAAATSSSTRPTTSRGSTGSTTASSPSPQDGRPPAGGYVVATPDAKGFDDPGVFVALPLVNQIRPRVKAWREAGYPGATGITPAAGALERPRAAGNAVLLLPARSDRDADLADRGAAGRAGRASRFPATAAPFPRLCAQDGDRLAARPSSWRCSIAWQVLNKVDLSAGHALRQERVRRRAGPDGARTACRC